LKQEDARGITQNLQAEEPRVSPCGRRSTTMSAFIAVCFDQSAHNLAIEDTSGRQLHHPPAWFTGAPTA